MKLIFRYMKPYFKAVLFAVVLKFIGTMCELLLPYTLEYLIDEVVPTKNMKMVIFCGLLMAFIALLTRFFNVTANRKGIENAHNVSYDVRKDLFEKTENLSGSLFDSFGLPSLISRMTSDSYNVQSCVQSLQMLCIRAPIMLVGGIVVTMTMDRTLSMILCIMLPILIVVIISVSRYGIPLYNKVQNHLDDVVRIMRENITGIRVVKALSKTEYEKKHFHGANESMAKADILAGTVMAIPGPFMQLCLNIGLVLVIVIGSRRINAGLMKPGVILAFLTYFNQIMMGVMGLNRIFMMISKASASANRMDLVLQANTDQKIYSLEEALVPQGDEYIRFENVNFNYGESENKDRQQTLTNINFAIKKGESLGIIGPTGCGKTTIINLLMRFYDVKDGGVFVAGRDVRTYEKDELHRLFGTVFQNDMIFNNTIRENIHFGRDISEAEIDQALVDAQVKDHIDTLEGGLDFFCDIKGANLSGGQKQRLYIARALANHPEILILDDSSSALDYKTDASLRKAISENHCDSTLIMIAQRVSSIQNMTNILVLDEGQCIGYGSHEHLLKTCDMYRSIYETQMGSLE